MNPFRQVDLFGGKGEVLIWDLLQGASAPPFTEVLACELQPGGSVGAHRQEHYPEIIVVTEGMGLATVDQTPHPLSPQTLLYLPLGSVLTLENTGDLPLDYLIIKAR